MPRTKGSRNKLKMSIDDQINTIEQEIEAMNAQIKEKKTALKALKKQKLAEEKAAAAAAVEARKNQLLDAFAESGKSVDEILELLK